MQMQMPDRATRAAIVGRVRRASAVTRHGFAVAARCDARSALGFVRPPAPEVLLFARAKRSTQEKARPTPRIRRRCRGAGSLRCSRARGRCRRAIHGAAATESNFLFDSPTALAALLGARQRGLKATAKQSFAREAAVAFDFGVPVSGAELCGERRGEPNRKFGSVAATPGMACLRRPRARCTAQGPAQPAPEPGCAFSCLLLFAQAKRSKSAAGGRWKKPINREPNPAANNKAKAAGYGAARLTCPTVGVMVDASFARSVSIGGHAP
ncbi:hypothetical protein SAMN04488038_10456 [Solimonas aquatica]|uniref:Uncharacterized protein n=1 Tax=Solimonas aquatica TaxID=489703 RepID=A0A1H9DIS2_9GAMM|nr:hypothetical protein SAMN04488038_10456 [Solimonas aquatica]